MNEKVEVRVDAGRWLGTLDHTWNYIGYDECNYTHAPGGMALIEKFGKLEKPYYMRAHHMLCTGIMHGFINGAPQTSIRRTRLAIRFITTTASTR